MPPDPGPSHAVYRVAIPSPLRRTFDYLAPSDGHPEIPPGSRVRVPFGKRTLVGWTIGLADNSIVDHERLKPIEAVIDREPLVDAALFELYLWAADYYLHPVGDALAQCFPTLLRQGNLPSAPRDTLWQLTARGLGLPLVSDYPDTLKRAPRQRQAVQLLQQHGRRSPLQLKQAGVSTAILRQLADKQLAEPIACHSEETAPGWDGLNLIREPLPTLYPDQRTALDNIDLHGFNTWLLQGETGSGKTEIYLRLAEQTLRYGKQVLVLVPEISLTPQTLQRFRDRFDCPVVTLHSGLTNHQRLENWNAARLGKAGIVLGTRSAIFTPLARTGLIVVDEEHDGSYKQQEGFRYSARDLAVMRGYRERVPVVLGSATPSLESLENVSAGRYRIATLSRPLRHNRPAAPWEFIDLRGQHLIAGFAPDLINACQRELELGNQVLIFLNRRGFAPTLLCHPCGWIAQCNHCDARLTVHRASRSLLCHHCGHRERLAQHCPRCESDELLPLGQGTERVEEALGHLLPNHPVLRVDRDSTRRRHAMDRILDQVHGGEPCILVGTQMIAKGHHFPDVTLVAIIDADNGLFSSDFRGPERLGQLITQVAGRAGRAEKPGRVLIQTHHADHPLLTELNRYGYPAFATRLRDERRVTAMPPFRHLVLLRAEAEQPQLADALLRAARHWLDGNQTSPEVTLLGPLPAPMERRAGRYRFQLSILDSDRARLHKLLRTLALTLESHPNSRKVRWSLDVDPVDMS